MGGCAGCMGPKRRQQNYKVNRLTQNSPIKSKISSSQLPVNRNKDRILQELNDQKKKYEHTNLINTLISSPIKPIGDRNFSNNVNSSTINIRTSFFQASPQSYQRDSYQRDSYQGDNIKSSGIIKLKKTQSNSFLPDQNIYQSKYFAEKPPFVSELKTGLMIESEKTSIQNSKVLAQIKMNKNSQIIFKKKNLSNIPQLTEEQSKTPLYVKEIRKQNGQDVRQTSLQSVPRKLDPAPKLNLQKYLKDLI